MAKGYGKQFQKNKKIVRQRNLTVGNGKHYCEYCGRTDLQTQYDGLPNFVTVDHLIPISKGGTHAIKNLIVCCRKCNENKSNNLPDLDNLRSFSL